MIPILFEDNHLLVVEKPVNMPSQADESGDRDLLTALKEMIKVREQKPGNVFLGLVHRLDRPVGGVMVFAKTSKAASRLAQTFQSRVCQKSYRAVARGEMKGETRRLVDHLLKDEATNTVSVVPQGTVFAKEAILEVTPIQVVQEMSLVHVELFTGRSHQIRVQLAHAGFPLFGDQKYGSQVNRAGEQLALWATTLSLPHPTTKEMLTFHSAPPQVFPWNQFSMLC